ncbi:MAG TPA: C4-dicarboxylate transporter DctA [Bryobacteraceae bacterium]|jgi:aerobic C4-dicarboxylate transport protein|nr:C4-dicarboxylate transporter DctA [Bryobacteraceae bacterium]
MTVTRNDTDTPKRHTLHLWVLAGIVAGVLFGFADPHHAEQMKPLGDGFIKLIRMVIAPIIFCTVVTGVANVGDMRKLGRVGIKALLYFEVVTTLALATGLLVVTLVRPGAGMNVNVSTLDPAAVQQYAGGAKALTTVDFLLNIIPDTFVNAFAKGEILQVLLVSILAGLALAAVRDGRPLVEAIGTISQVLFGIVDIIMKTAPIGAFGAMAFTIGKYGLRSLLPLGKVILCMGLTSLFFVFIVLALVAHVHRFSVFKLVKYLEEELLIVLGTSSSEPALPGLMAKMEAMGCSKSVVGLVVPSGYSFNLDGTAIYLTIASIFVAQATNTHLTITQTLTMLLVLMLTSKGAAAVTGGAFITLAATLSSMGTIPVAGITLLLGIDRFMSQIRSLTNLVGNGVATVVIAKWENEFAEPSPAMEEPVPVIESELSPDLT